MAAGFSQSIAIGSLGNLNIAESGGKVSATFSVNKSIGGGSTAGVITVVESLTVTGNGIQAIDAGFLLAEKQWPALAPELAIAKMGVDTIVATL